MGANISTATAPAPELLASLTFLVSGSGMRNTEVLLKNGLKVRSLQVITRYPPDLVCQINAVCKDSSQCRENVFNALRQAVSQRLGLVVPADIYLDKDVPAVLTASDFGDYVTHFALARCRTAGSGGDTMLLDNKTLRYRKACKLGTRRNSKTGQCRRVSCKRSRKTGRCRSKPKP